MKCPFCGYESSKTTDSRKSANGVYRIRKRKCFNCGKEFKTVEMEEEQFKKLASFYKNADFK